LERTSGSDNDAVDIPQAPPVFFATPDELKKRTRKISTPVIQSVARRFTRRCLNSAGYRPLLVVDSQPKLKKRTRAKLLIPEHDLEENASNGADHKRKPRSRSQSSYLPLQSRSCKMWVWLSESHHRNSQRKNLKLTRMLKKWELLSVPWGIKSSDPPGPSHWIKIIATVQSDQTCQIPNRPGQLLL
jgi:hypothetical protein